MTDIELLNWARGPAFQYATIIFILGVVIRFFEIFLLGRQKNLAESRGSEMGGGLRTIVMRMIPSSANIKQAAFSVTIAYIFHIGFLVTLFFYAPHILVFQELTGYSWVSLPSSAIDALTVVTIVALFITLILRVTDPVKRYLSRFDDYLSWLLTILPLITGYLAFHRIGASPQLMIAMHILSVELFMVLFPFTKLMHTFTLFTSRWYNGAFAGYKGVKS